MTVADFQYKDLFSTLNVCLYEIDTKKFTKYTIKVLILDVLHVARNIIEIRWRQAKQYRCPMRTVYLLAKKMLLNERHHPTEKLRSWPPRVCPKRFTIGIQFAFSFIISLVTNLDLCDYLME